jgi:hypothetical protein
MPHAVRITRDCDALARARADSERLGYVQAGSILPLLREDERHYYKVAFADSPAFVPKSCADIVDSGETPAQPDERAGRLAGLLVGSGVVFVSSSLAGIFTGAYWHSAGLVIGPSYWGLYLGSLLATFLAGRRRFALGMLAALPIAVPAFFGLAALSSFPTAP